MRHRIAADELLIHVALPRQPLDVGVRTHGDEPLAPLVIAVEEVLQHAEDEEHPAVHFHEPRAGIGELLRIAGRQEVVDRVRRQASAEHRVVDALARGRSDDPGGIAGQYNVTAIVPALGRLHRDRRALAADRLGPLKAARLAECRRRALEREALDRRTDANAGVVAMREDPAVEVRRHLPLIEHIAPGRAVGALLGLRGFHDFVVGEHIRQVGRFRHFGAGNRRIGAVSPDHRAGADLAHRAVFRVLGRFLAIADDRHPGMVARDRHERPGPAGSAVARCALAQPLVERVAIDHADVAAVDRHLDLAIRWGNHPRRANAGNHQVLRDFELLDQPRRDSAAARLDAAGPIEQQHTVALSGEIVGRGRPRRATADHNGVVGLDARHDEGPSWRYSAGCRRTEVGAAEAAASTEE